MARKTSKQNLNTEQFRKQRKKSKLYFLLNVVLEAIAIGAVVFCLFSASCVLGNEVGGAVFIFSIFIFSAFIPDLFYLMLSRKLHTLGIDPLGVMFNFLIGIICILIGISLILVIISFCGNYAQFILMGAGAFSVCSGMLHLLNAFMCHKKLPKSERYYRPRRRKASKADKKKAKPARKGDKKGAKGESKKGDKKGSKKADKKGSNKKADKQVDKKAAKSKAAPAGKKPAAKKGVK